MSGSKKIPISSLSPYKRHSSWIRVPGDEWPYSSNGFWKAPIEYPGDPEDATTSKYKWDEDLYQSDNIKGWIEIE